MRVKIGKYPNWRFYHHWLYNWFGYTPKQKTKVRIDRYDTWSMDHTLALIIHPMLVQLKATKHGYPADLTEQEWDEILDEMIWAFEQKCRDDWESDYYEHHVLSPDEKNYDGFFGGSKLVCKDPKGLKAHQERISNGFRLFGTYFENLWD